MQQQQQPSGFATPQRAAGSGGSGHTQPHAGQASTRFDALHGGSRSRSPMPRFPSDAVPGRPPSQRLHSASPPSPPPQSKHPPRPHPTQQSPASQQRTPSLGGEGRRRRVGGERGTSGGWRQRADSVGEAHGYARRLSPSGNSPDEERRRSQREKQIQYGYVTDGYTNMKRLIAHDPLLRSGGILPLSPPAIVKGSKRLWDIQLRKWRRALHMFDHVFIEGEDDPATRAAVLEEQRLQWVSEAFHDVPRARRVHISLDALRRVQASPAVPRKIPVEDDLRCILRRDDCYESVRSVVPQSASSLTKGTDISPLEAGIKIHIAPSAAVLQRQQAQLEMQQRLSSLHQQQQQQQQQTAAAVGGRADADALPSSLAAEALTEAPAAARHTCLTPAAPREGSWQQQQQPRLSDEHSPSPRRPPAASSMEPRRTPSRVFGAPQGGAPHPHSESAVTPSQQRTRFVSAAAAAAAELTEHARKYGDSASRQSGSPVPHSGADAADFLHTPSMPRNTVLAPPPPLPMTRTTGATRSSAAAAAGDAAPAPSPLWPMAGRTSGDAAVAAVPCCHHCGHAVWAPAAAVPGGGFLFHDTRGGGGSSSNACGNSNAFVPGMLFPEGAPCVPGAAFTAGAASAMVAPQPFTDPAGLYLPRHAGGISGAAHDPHQHQHHRQTTHSGAAHAAQLYTAPGTREARRRSGAAAAAAAAGTTGTPQTVPRFVARLSSSPNEQRLGDCWGEAAAAHGPVAVHGALSTAANVPAALPPSSASASAVETRDAVVQVAGPAVRAETSRSLAAVTPERALFDAGVIAEGVSTEARQLHGRRSLGSSSPQHFDPLRDSPFGKPGALTDAEDVPVVPLVFDVDA